MSDQYQQEQESSGWRPDAGDTVTGTVAEVSTGDGGYGPYPIVSLDTADGPVSVHAFHTVLRNELAKRRPKPGDSLTVKYLGKTPDKDGRRGYHSYRVQGGSGQSYDWSREEGYEPPSGDQTGGVAQVPEPEPDLPVESAGLPEPRQAPTQQDLDQQFGDVPF